MPVDGAPERSSGVKVDAADRDIALARRCDGLDFWTATPRVMTVGSRLLTGWRRRVILWVVASFILINAYGLCSTYGHVGFG